MFLGRNEFFFLTDFCEDYFRNTLYIFVETQINNNKLKKEGKVGTALLYSNTLSNISL